MILSTMAVFFRDLEYLWSVGLMIIMYASAIFYKPEKLLKSGFGWILKCNPLYLLIHNFRQAVFGIADEYEVFSCIHRVCNRKCYCRIDFLL